jgi:hypothetical protein
VHIHYEGKWEGVGPCNSRVFWALWNGMQPIGECHLGPKKLCINHRCINSYTASTSKTFRFRFRKNKIPSAPLLCSFNCSLANTNFPPLISCSRNSPCQGETSWTMSLLLCSCKELFCRNQFSGLSQQNIWILFHLFMFFFIVTDKRYGRLQCLQRCRLFEPGTTVVRSTTRFLHVSYGHN